MSLGEAWAERPPHADQQRQLLRCGPQLPLAQSLQMPVSNPSSPTPDHKFLSYPLWLHTGEEAAAPGDGLLPCTFADKEILETISLNSF